MERSYEFTMLCKSPCQRTHSQLYSHMNGCWKVLSLIKKIRVQSVYKPLYCSCWYVFGQYAPSLSVSLTLLRVFQNQQWIGLWELENPAWNGSKLSGQFAPSKSSNTSSNSILRDGWNQLQVVLWLQIAATARAAACTAAKKKKKLRFSVRMAVGEVEIIARFSRTAKSLSIYYAFYYL